MFGIGIYRVQDIAANGTADGYQHYSCWACAAQLVRGQSDTLRVNTITDEWQHLATSLKADSAGYVRITLVNESGTPAYFNNFTVGTVDPNHYQENHYDPWGLNLWASSAQSGYIGNENIRLL